MRKVFSIYLGYMFLVSIAACEVKGDYTCECADGSTAGYVSVGDYVDVTQTEAENSCSQYSSVTGDDCRLQ